MFDTTHEETDLIGNSPADGDAPTGTTDGKETDLTEGKEIQADKSTKAEAKRLEQAKAWAAKGRDALSTLPADKEWLRPYIESELSLREKGPEIDRIVEQKLAEREKKMEVDRKYDTLKQTLFSFKPNSDQLEKVQARQDQLLAKGVPKDEALEIAIEAAGINLDPEERDRLILRKRMALPEQGTGEVSERDIRIDDPDFHKKIKNPKERMKALMSQLRNN